MASCRIPLSVPQVGERELHYLTQCIRTNWVSSEGPMVVEFEKAVARRLGAAHAVATINGTAALHAALLACGIGRGDAVLVPTLTFVATTNAVLYAGARPVFLDCDPDRWTLTPEIVRAYLESPQRDPGVRAILPVHLYGRAAPMEGLMGVAKQHGLLVVEDAAESLGSRSGSRATGTWGNAGCLSFNGNKIITSGAGGMVVTDDASLAGRLRHLTTQARSDAVEYEHDEVGFNYRMSNLQAAVGLAQLERLDEILQRKRAILQRYVERLQSVAGIRVFPDPRDPDSNAWLTCILVDPVAYGEDRESVRRRLADAGIETRPLFTPNHVLAPYRDCPRGSIQVAEDLHRFGLCLPSSGGLRDSEVDEVCDGIRR